MAGAGAPSQTPATMEMPPPPSLGDLLATIPRGDPGKVIAMPEDESAAFFDDKRVHDVDVSIAPDDLALIDSDPSAEMYVNAEVKMDGESLGTVGLRYKGSAGAFIAPCTAAMYPGEMRGAKVGKCSMKLDIDRVNGDQRLFGLKKLNLHAMGRDPSMMREMLGYSLFREMGIATPRTTYARVVINGELEGLFLGVEQIDGRFTRARFTEGGKGNVYKEAWPNTLDPGRYLAALETNEDDDDVNVMSMLAFATAVQFEPEAALNWLDRNYMLNYIAVDRMILNDDGAFRFYCNTFFGMDFGGSRNHNFYWYESPIGTRLWLMPWDLDLSFAGALRTRVDRDWRDDSVCDCHLAEGVERASRQRAPACDPLIGEVADWLDDYDQAVDKFIQGPLSAKAVESKLMRWIDLIQPDVKEAAGVNSAPSESEWQDAIATLRMVIDHTRETRGHWPGF
ncbi:MAG TPA: CotH kinase family protein [Polyangiales bacterium]|nr:CotH kinase family protein [Polyangiales bacterium]